MSILPAWLESFAFNHHKLWKWYVSLCGGYMKYVSWHQTYKLAVYLFLFSQFCFNVVIEWKFIWKWHNCFWKILLLVYLERERECERERDVLPMSYSSNEGYSTTHATWPKQILLAVSVEILFHYDKVQSSLV